MSSQRNDDFSLEIKGEGPTLVMVHGYLESKEIWYPFLKYFENQYTVVLPDLPGHGHAPVLSETHTMEMLAQNLRTLLRSRNFDQVFMVGHSLGGYVTLAFAELFPELLSGYCLFHSHPFADSSETIAKRNREIELVKQGKKDLIIQTNIPKAFAPEFSPTHLPVVEWASRIAMATPDRGMMSMLRGMMGRPDRSRNFFNTSIPALWLLGKQDQYINYQSIMDRLPENHSVRIKTLEKSGHMGFVEEPEQAAEILNDFIKRSRNFR